MAGLIKAAQFYENEPRLFALAEALTTKYDVLAMIYDNLLLFRSYIYADCIRYADLADALWNLQPESVLIYFAEINLYGIFTTKSYLNFCRNLSDKVEDGDIAAENLSVYQGGHIILLDHQHGFICDEKLYHLINYVILELAECDDTIAERFTRIIARVNSIIAKDRDTDKLSQISNLKELISHCRIPTVYFITDAPFTGRAKIGRSFDCEKRLKQLQTGNPTPLKIYDKIYTHDCVKLEKELHTQFKDRRIQGEWFTISTKEIGDLVKKHDVY